MKKHFRYHKITPGSEEGMRIMKKNGCTYKEIAQNFGVSKETVIYHLNSKFRLRSLKNSNKWQTKHRTKRSMRKANKKHRIYRSAYIKERYNLDPEFRAKFIRFVKKYQAKKKKEWLRKGLCPKCGRKRAKDYNYCKRCRKKQKIYDSKYKRGKNGRQMQNNKRHNKS
jgi:hypothetical protein